MKAKWWSCVLGLLSMPAEVIMNTWTVYQNPSAMLNVRVNSSLDITCSTSMENPVSLSLKRRFLGNEDVLFLYLKNGRFKDTPADKFRNRINIIQESQVPGSGYMIKLKLSSLGLEDTDLYYCSWVYYPKSSYSPVALETNGTAIIVREGGDVEECGDHYLDLILICIVAFSTILLMFVCAMILGCMRFKKRWTPCRPAERPLPATPPGTNQPGQIYLQYQTVNHYPYMMTSTNNYGIVGNL